MKIFGFNKNYDYFCVKFVKLINFKYGFFI